MRHHRLSMSPHPFIPDPSVRALTPALEPCERCGMYRTHRLHTDYVPPSDDSDRIIGEGHDAA